MVIFNKDEEIARLQDQIRRIKEEQEREQAVALEAAETETPSRNYDGRQLVDKRSNELERVRGKDMPFSEGDLISANIISNDDGEESSLMQRLPAVLLAIGAFVLLIGFAQVPVGQEDLSRYSAAPLTQTIDLGDLNPDRPTQ
jgi:hypothetical protein